MYDKRRVELDVSSVDNRMQNYKIVRELWTGKDLPFFSSTMTCEALVENVVILEDLSHLYENNEATDIIIDKTYLSQHRGLTKYPLKLIEFSFQGKEERLVGLFMYNRDPYNREDKVYFYSGGDDYYMWPTFSPKDY